MRHRVARKMGRPSGAGGGGRGAGPAGPLTSIWVGGFFAKPSVPPHTHTHTRPSPLSSSVPARRTNESEQRARAAGSTHARRDAPVKDTSPRRIWVSRMFARCAAPPATSPRHRERDLRLRQRGASAVSMTRAADLCLRVRVRIGSGGFPKTRTGSRVMFHPFFGFRTAHGRYSNWAGCYRCHY